MTTPQSTSEFYRSQQRLKLATLVAVRLAWSRMARGRTWETAWKLTVGPQILLLLIAAKLAAARASSLYVPNVLGELKISNEPVAALLPQSLADTSSAGLPLDGLLYGSVVTAGKAFNAGATVEEALDRGGSWLDTVVTTEVADAARVGTGVNIAVRPVVTGYIRYLNPPSCARCAILAGRFYRWSEGFQRHPNCDCVMQPSTEEMAPGLIDDPMEAWRRGMVTGLSKADTQAVNDGADLGQVVNIRLKKAGLTTAGGRVLERGGRVTPEGIYHLASDRDQAIKFLRKAKYIT